MELDRAKYNLTAGGGSRRGSEGRGHNLLPVCQGNSTPWRQRPRVMPSSGRKPVSSLGPCRPWSSRSLGHSGETMASRLSAKRVLQDDPARHTAPEHLRRLGVIIPALNEERSVGIVVQRLIHTIGELPVSCRIIVADNGSTDSTAFEAKKAGAETIFVPERGYGAACMEAVRLLDDWPDFLAFIDADGSSLPEEIGRLVVPLLEGKYEMALGARSRKVAMTLSQRWGTQLAVWLVNRRWGTAYKDMGPFRCIARSSLARLGLRDRSWGWTIEMQIQAIRCGLSFIEVPVSWEDRLAGKSKI